MRRNRWTFTTHLLPRNQQDGALLGVHHLAENVVKDEKLAPAILEKFHLVVDLKQNREKRDVSKKGIVYFSGLRVQDEREREKSKSEAEDSFSCSSQKHK